MMFKIEAPHPCLGDFGHTTGPLVLWGATATALKERGWAAEPPREMSDANSNTDVTSVSADDPRGPFDVEMEVPWSANETGWNAVFAARDGQILRFDLGADCCLQVMWHV